MAMNLTRKIISAHLTKPSAMNPGDEIYVHFDQTLTTTSTPSCAIWPLRAWASSGCAPTFR